MGLALSRPPVTPDELWHLVRALWGVSIPRNKVCEDHTPPFTAFAEGFFGNRNNYALWYGSRGTGKSYMLAILALTKAAVLDIEVTLLGGSMAQSQNVHEHVESLLRSPNAPLDVISRSIATEVEFVAGNWIRPLPASQKTVRGPHPHMTLLDEIDEMELKIYNAAMGQALTKPNAKGHVIPEMVIASSTWQNPIGTFETVLRDAEGKGLPVHTWCWREVVKSVENPDGWMDEDFIQRKRNTVPAEMFRVEYELGEPSGTARAFDLTALSQCLTDVEPIRHYDKTNDVLFVFEEALDWGTYATGADWAKESDMTVITTWRIDVEPCTLVHLRAMNRKPWPEMIGIFNEVINTYQGTSAHDATGIGNVVGDLIDERTIKFVMVGRERLTMLTEYIAAVERGMYAIPRAARKFVNSHKSTTVDDIYRTTLVSSSHLPDEVASAALAHRAATRGGHPGMVDGAKKKDADQATMPTWMEELDNLKAPPRETVIAGYVTQLPDDDDVGVFWLND